MPDLDSETDAGYFDDFTNEEDMAKYKEVHEKQMALEGMADRNEKLEKKFFVGFTFKYGFSNSSLFASLLGGYYIDLCRT